MSSDQSTSKPNQDVQIKQVVATKMSDLFAMRAKWQDSLKQPPFLEDPENVLDDKDGFLLWSLGKTEDQYTLLESWFRERTGTIVCCVFLGGIGYRPKHIRNESGVWITWQKLPRWFTNMVHINAKGNGSK